MARESEQRIRAAAEAVLVDGERITAKGTCWAAQRRGRVPLPFVARRQYLLVLTDRRLLVFERSRRGPQPTDLVIGKRYEAFGLDRVRRGPFLMQVKTRANSGNELVFEFRRRHREIGGELVARLTPGPAAGANEPAELSTAAGDSGADMGAFRGTP
jgi:hypothetical protein